MKLIWSAVAQIVVTNPFSMVWAMSKFRTPLDGEKSASLRAEIKSVTTVTDMNKSHAADAVSQVTRVGLPISLALATSRPVYGMQKRIVVAAALAKAIRAVRNIEPAITFPRRVFVMTTILHVKNTCVQKPAMPLRTGITIALYGEMRSAIGLVKFTARQK